MQVGFYVPEGRIQVDQGAEVWGALVADEIEVNQGTRFHFDVNLRNFELPWEIPTDTSQASAPQVISWARIEFPIQEFHGDRRDPFTLLDVTRADLRAPWEAWEEPEPGQTTDKQ